MLRTAVVSLACLLPSLVVGYPTGAPVKVCESMIPKHGVDGQSSIAPYYIYVPQLAVEGGDTVQVTIMPTTTGGVFKGFFLQARSHHTDEIIHGQFAKVTPWDPIQTRNCNGGYNNSMTHADRSEKTIVTVEWTAPWDLDEDVVFVATVVRDGYTWWSKVTSKVLSSSTDVPLPSATPTPGPSLLLMVGAFLCAGARHL